MVDFRESEGLYRTHAASDWGRIQDNGLRFGKYKPDDMADSDWVKLLGPDVNNLQHMWLMRNMGVGFVRHSMTHQPDLFTDESATRLISALAIHDIGEAPKGDKSFGDKTKNNEDDEMDDFDLVASEVFPERLELLSDLKRIIFDHNGENHPDGAVLFAVEGLGYLRTALKAAEIFATQQQTDATQAGLSWIVADVLHNQAVKVMADAKKFSATKAAIAAHTGAIDNAFEVVESTVQSSSETGWTAFSNYPTDEKRQYVIAKFLEAQRVWEQYSSTI